MKIIVDLKILDDRLHEQMPAYATTGSAGRQFLRLCINTTITLTPQRDHAYPTGMAIHLDNIYYAALILPRWPSTGHKHGIVLGNLVGLIDSPSQLMVSCWNRGNTAFELDAMERIAQLVIVPVVQDRISLSR